MYCPLQARRRSWCSQNGFGGKSMPSWSSRTFQGCCFTKKQLPIDLVDICLLLHQVGMVILLHSFGLCWSRLIVTGSKCAFTRSPNLGGRPNIDETYLEGECVYRHIICIVSWWLSRSQSVWYYSTLSHFARCPSKDSILQASWKNILKGDLVNIS